jgi:hypothetical protein
VVLVAQAVVLVLEMQILAVLEHLVKALQVVILMQETMLEQAVVAQVQ